MGDVQAVTLFAKFVTPTRAEADILSPYMGRARERFDRANRPRNWNPDSGTLPLFC